MRQTNGTTDILTFARTNLLRLMSVCDSTKLRHILLSCVCIMCCVVTQWTFQCVFHGFCQDHPTLILYRLRQLNFVKIEINTTSASTCYPLRYNAVYLATAIQFFSWCFIFFVILRFPGRNLPHATNQRDS